MHRIAPGASKDERPIRCSRAVAFEACSTTLTRRWARASRWRAQIW